MERGGWNSILRSLPGDCRWDLTWKMQGWTCSPWNGTPRVSCIPWLLFLCESGFKDVTNHVERSLGVWTVSIGIGEKKFWKEICVIYWYIDVSRVNLINIEIYYFLLLFLISYYSWFYCGACVQWWQLESH